MSAGETPALLGTSFGKEERPGSIIRPALMNEGKRGTPPNWWPCSYSVRSYYGHWNSETCPNPNTDWLQVHLSQQADVDKSSQLDPQSRLCQCELCVIWTALSSRIRERVPGHSNREAGVLSRVMKLEDIKCRSDGKGPTVQCLSQSRALSQARTRGSWTESSSWVPNGSNHSPDLPSFRDEKLEVLQHYSLWLKCLKSK